MTQNRIKTIAMALPRAIMRSKSARNGLLGLEISVMGLGAVTVHESGATIEKTIKAIPGIKKSFLSWEKASKIKGDVNKASIAINKTASLKAADVALFNRNKAAVMRIMNEDKNCVSSVNKEKIAELIVSGAKEFDMDPIHIACIAKKETHFQHITKNSVKGIMQISKTAIDDMYQRPELYHSRLSAILKEYPTSDALFTAIQKKPGVNIRIGSLIFQHRLDNADGNVKKALKLYNASPQREKYSIIIMKDINKYKQS